METTCSMNHGYLLIVLFALELNATGSADTAAPLAKLLSTAGSLSECESVLYVAQDQARFRRYGWLSLWYR